MAKYGREAFDIGENYINVTIPFAFVPTMAFASQIGLLPYQTRVLEVLANHPTFTLKEVASTLNLGTTRISEIVDELKTLGKLERIGYRKGGYWKVNRWAFAVSRHCKKSIHFPFIERSSQIVGQYAIDRWTEFVPDGVDFRSGTRNGCIYIVKAIHHSLDALNFSINATRRFHQKHNRFFRKLI